uniref:NADH-ubiquinone oxidoreductase chain 6 n=1 Tax=Haliotis ovina TaxID=36099 RepID=A0A7T3U792_9VEST|nr:NADH dehydrogenase subunit 6 [Haliotis ovina]QPZ53799.1 NADH dehydrogenase subunit 6 [Haliotis ovina]UFI48613.1 NADH dehydrogenase subunit 6 [Haliotis ovina]UFI48619.1 NADH dehydrogenase subunit 6 [Haliotis ovina]
MVVLCVFSICFSLLVVMPVLSQPLALGVVVLLFSLFSCMMVGVCVSSWYGYVLFLVYVGGLLVMFAYVAALVPNSVFLGFWVFFGFFCGLMLSIGLYLLLYVQDYKVVAWVGDFGGEKFLFSSGFGLVSSSGVSVMVTLGVVLLINLLAVVKVCYYQQGPLRFHSELK